MAEFEFAGTTFRGGKMFAVLTALSTLGGGAWAGFEFYKDYMDMKEIIQNIDIDAIAAENALVVQKLDESMLRIDEATTYTRDIKNDLKDDLLKMEGTLDRLDAKVDEAVDKTKASIETFEIKTENTIDKFEIKTKAQLDEAEADLKKAQDELEVMSNNLKLELEKIRDTMGEIRSETSATLRDVEMTMRESEKDTRDVMKETRTDLELKMDELEKDVKETIEEALDNPLND